MAAAEKPAAKATRLLYSESMRNGKNDNAGRKSIPIVAQ